MKKNTNQAVSGDLEPTAYEVIGSSNGAIATSRFNDHIIELEKMISAAREILPDHFQDVQLPEAGIDGWRSMAERYVESDVRLEKMAKALETFSGVFADVCELIGGGDEEATQDNKDKLRHFTIMVTEGMLRNHMLTLTNAKQRGLIAEGEQFILTPKDGETITTTLVQPGNRLQARKAIWQFYERFSVKAGERIVMEEHQAGEWNLYPLKGWEKDLNLDGLLADLDDIKNSEKERSK
jgi:hypothetical protein